MFLKCRVSKLPEERFSGFILVYLCLLFFLKTCFVGGGNREKAGLRGEFEVIFTRDRFSTGNSKRQSWWPHKEIKK